MRIINQGGRGKNEITLRDELLWIAREKGATLQEIGELFSISSQRVDQKLRQIEEKEPNLSYQLGSFLLRRRESQ